MRGGVACKHQVEVRIEGRLPVADRQLSTFCPVSATVKRWTGNLHCSWSFLPAVTLMEELVVELRRLLNAKLDHDKGTSDILYLCRDYIRRQSPLWGNKGIGFLLTIEDVQTAAAAQNAAESAATNEPESFWEHGVQRIAKRLARADAPEGWHCIDQITADGWIEDNAIEDGCHHHIG